MVAHAVDAETFDLSRPEHYALVRRIFYGHKQGLARRCRAAGIDPEDALQHVCMSLLNRTPYDPSRGVKLATWLGFCAGGTVHAMLVTQARRSVEILGAEQDLAAPDSSIRLVDIQAQARPGSYEEAGRGEVVELATTRVRRRRLVPRRWHARRTRVVQLPPFVGWAPDEVTAKRRRERLEWCQGLSEAAGCKSSAFGLCSGRARLPAQSAGTAQKPKTLSMASKTMSTPSSA